MSIASTFLSKTHHDLTAATNFRWIRSLNSSFYSKWSHVDLDLSTGERRETCAPVNVVELLIVRVWWSPASDMCVEDVLLICLYDSAPVLTVSSVHNVPSNQVSVRSLLHLCSWQRQLILFLCIAVPASKTENGLRIVPKKPEVPGNHHNIGKTIGCRLQAHRFSKNTAAKEKKLIKPRNDRPEETGNS